MIKILSRILGILFIFIPLGVFVVSMILIVFYSIKNAPGEEPGGFIW